MAGREPPRLAPVDEANLVLDRVGQVNVFLVAARLAPGGFVDGTGIPDLAALRAALAPRIAGLPALLRVPAPAGRRHRWADGIPDLEEHIRLVDAVAGMAGLERLCGELMTVPLARDRPLWEILVVPGVAPGRTGLVLRIHHATADGMAAVAIVRQLLEPAAPPPAAPEPEAGVPRRADRRGRLARIAYAARRMRLTLTGAEVGATVLLGERSALRGVAFRDADLATLRERAHALGATVNDALLAGVAAGYLAALRAAGDDIPATLPVSIPVALRRRGSSANQVGVMLVRLPLGEADADERVRLIAAQTTAEKSVARAQGTLEFMRGPLGARLMNHLARRQHLVGGFVTNVPGPAETLRLAGAPVEAFWPVAVLAANVRLGVAAISYAGRLSWGVHFDAESVPGAEFARAMSGELARLGG